MTLHEVIRLIANSTPSEWNTISHGDAQVPAHAGCKFQSTEEEMDTDVHLTHTTGAAFLPNPLITLAWGKTFSGDFEEPWANRFPERHATGELVDVLYAGAPVYQDRYVVVDGGRALLPLPDVESLTVPAAKLRFFQLLDALDSPYGANGEYTRRAGIKAVDEPWPVFEKGRAKG